MRRLASIRFCVVWLSVVPAAAQFLAAFAILHTDGAAAYWLGPSVYKAGLAFSALWPFFIASLAPSVLFGLAVSSVRVLDRFRLLTIALGGALTGVLTWVIAKATALSFDHLLFHVQRGAEGPMRVWGTTAVVIYVLAWIARRIPDAVRPIVLRFRALARLSLIVLAALGCSGPSTTQNLGARVAVTQEELGRLRAAFGSEGEGREPVARRIRSADTAISEPLVFPPRGGQHNQWYQCETHQIALRSEGERHVCPVDEQVFSGYPFDDVVFSRVHFRNLDRALDAAWAFALTEEEKYLRFARRVLLGYADRYLTYPYHANGMNDLLMAGMMGGHLEEQTLDEAVLLSRKIGPAYDLIREALTEPERARIEDDLIRPMLETIGKCRFGKSNWQSWHNAGMLAGGVLLDDPSYVDRALYDPYNGLGFQLEHCVSEEGMWYENSWGYHFYTLEALVTLAESARRAGLDGWQHPVLAQMLLLPMRYAMPDGSLPRFGDAVSTRPGRPHLFDAAYSALGDPRLCAGTSSSPTWSSVVYGRRSAARDTEEPGGEVFQSAGHAILRSTGEKRLTTAITFGQPGGFHGHFDKLSFVFFGYGRELGVDPGRAKSQAYRLPIHRDWYRATIGHNTVVVDGRSQRPAGGKLTHFAATDRDAVAVVRCSTAYEGVLHDRLVYQSESYLLVLDRMSSSAHHVFDWVYHGLGELISHSPGDEAGLGDGQGVEYIRSIRRLRASAPSRLAFVTADVTTNVTITSVGHLKVFLGNGPFRSVEERAPLILARDSGASALFAATLEPVRFGERASIDDVEVRTGVSDVVATVTQGGCEDRVVWRKEEVRVLHERDLVVVARAARDQ